MTDPLRFDKNTDCAHLYERFRWWPIRDRYRCVHCGLVTRRYDSADLMAMRPAHKHMTVAVPGYNTVKDGS